MNILHLNLDVKSIYPEIDDTVSKYVAPQNLLRVWILTASFIIYIKL